MFTQQCCRSRTLNNPSCMSKTITENIENINIEKVQVSNYKFANYSPVGAWFQYNSRRPCSLTDNTPYTVLLCAVCVLPLVRSFYTRRHPAHTDGVSADSSSSVGGHCLGLRPQTTPQRRYCCGGSSSVYVQIPNPIRINNR